MICCPTQRFRDSWFAIQGPNFPKKHPATPERTSKPFPWRRQAGFGALEAKLQEVGQHRVPGPQVQNQGNAPHPEHVHNVSKIQLGQNTHSLTQKSEWCALNQILEILPSQIPKNPCDVGNSVAIWKQNAFAHPPAFLARFSCGLPPVARPRVQYAQPTSPAPRRTSNTSQGWAAARKLEAQLWWRYTNERCSFQSQPLLRKPDSLHSPPLLEHQTNQGMQTCQNILGKSLNDFPI